MEATSRCLFALAVAVGIAEGQTAVALGMAAAPIVSLAVVPPALARRLAPAADAAADADPAQLDAAARDEPAAREPEFTLAHGTGFAAAVLRRSCSASRPSSTPARCSSRPPRAPAARRSPASRSTCC